MHLEVANLSKRFPSQNGTVAALESVDLHVETGELVCAVGASGSGKSTLLRLIAGLELPTSGSIRADGYPIVGPGSDRGMIFQSYTLYPWMTVAQNVEFGLKLQGALKQERQRRAAYYWMLWA